MARLAGRLAPPALAECVASSGRARRLACIEASAFGAPSVSVLSALCEALIARDRAVAVAAGAALERLLEPRRLAAAEVGLSDRAEVVEALERAAVDARLGPDVRVAALHALAPMSEATPDAALLLRDPDPVVRREAVVALAGRTASAGPLATTAAEDRDDSVAAMAVAALCETGNVSRAVDARVRGWLAGASLGPASLGPLLACARAQPQGPHRLWLDAATRSPRPDVRALVAPAAP